MNENFKTELAAFARDVRAICESQVACADCPLSLGEPPSCVANYSHFNLDIATAAVEASRERKKPCAEVIDRALDIYTFEVEAERSYTHANEPIPVKEHADFIATFLYLQLYGGTPLSSAVRVLSAKRFVLESHKEGEDTE